MTVQSRRSALTTEEWSAPVIELAAAAELTAAASTTPGAGAPALEVDNGGRQVDPTLPQPWTVVPLAIVNRGTSDIPRGSLTITIPLDPERYVVLVAAPGWRPVASTMRRFTFAYSAGLAVGARSREIPVQVRGTLPEDQPEVRIDALFSAPGCAPVVSALYARG